MHPDSNEDVKRLCDEAKKVAERVGVHFQIDPARIENFVKAERESLAAKHVRG